MPLESKSRHRHGARDTGGVLATILLWSIILGVAGYIGLWATPPAVPTMPPTYPATPVSLPTVTPHVSPLSALPRALPTFALACEPWGMLAVNAWRGVACAPPCQHYMCMDRR